MKSFDFKKIAFVALWAASLLLVAQWGHSQTAQPKPWPSPGAIISGDEIGFRVQDFGGSGTSIHVTGQWMAKIDGAWYPIQDPGAVMKPLTAR
jgi:hypothetical protein